MLLHLSHNQNQLAVAKHTHTHKHKKIIWTNLNKFCYWLYIMQLLTQLYVQNRSFYKQNTSTENISTPDTK
jgi:hypothetical protein